MTGLRRLALAGALTCAAANPALANEMIIGFGVGGGYDKWARAIADHMGDHMPGKPSLVPKNMPGAGSVKATNWLYNVAPRDGTVIAAISRDATLLPITGAKGAKFDSRKLAWIGSPTTETNICIAYKTAPVKTAADLFDEELILGDTGVGTGTHTYPAALRALLGMKFKLISGYKSSVEVMLAMEQGEVAGICESYDSVVRRHKDWIDNGTIRILFQAGAHPNPKIKDVPFILDLAKTDEQRRALKFLYAGQRIGRPFVGPPGMAPETVAMLRAAFAATLKDPAFLAEAAKLKLDIDPVSGAELAALIEELYATPKAVIDKISAALGPRK